jgi:hypothetical protein
VEFGAGNLLNFSEDLPAGFNHLDLIICRNVFIYFNKEAFLKVMAKFARLAGEGKIHFPYSFLPCKSLPVDGRRNRGFEVFLSFLWEHGITLFDK